MKQAGEYSPLLCVPDPYEDSDENCWLRANFSWLFTRWFCKSAADRPSFHEFAVAEYERYLANPYAYDQEVQQ